MSEGEKDRLRRLEEENRFLRGRIQEGSDFPGLCDRVFSMVSHEMRTPLTAILGMAEYLLEKEPGPDLRHEFLSIIIKQGERLKDLIENLLSLQRLLAGFGLENPGPVVLSALLQKVAEGFRTPLLRHTIQVDCDAGLSSVYGEAGKIQHAVENLLGNAVKYSPAGSRIVLGARAEGDRALVWVKDEGPGIPAEEQDKIFEYCYRVGGRKSPAGTGLGLTLVREIAQAHGGRVWVESVPGEGSTFFLSLPLAG